jgi:polar amino acid transport system substrate-binding protein
MKKKILSLCLLTLCFFHVCHAKQAPLRVAIPAFSPPFVVQSGPNNFYGFDIATIEYVCQKLERQCIYYPMDLDELLPAIMEDKVDVAIGGIIITLKRAKQVRFSSPYLISKGQFIGKTNIKLPPPPYDLSQLSKKRVGILESSSFERMLRIQDVEKPELIVFERPSQMIDSLRAGTVFVALVSFPKARYWVSNSAGAFKRIGKSFNTGFGFGIAVTPKDYKLIEAINLAVLEYKESKEFKRNYDMYMRFNLQD